MDSDGDGLDNIFVIEKEEYADSFPAYLATFDISENTYQCTQPHLSLQGTPDKIRSADFNADGMPDLLITTSSGYYIYWNKNGRFSDSDRYPSIAPNTAFKKCDIIEAGDFDGDGLVDLIINKHDSNQWFIARNTGSESNGYFSLREINALISRNVRVIEDKEDKTYCLVQDIDGDGKSDAIVGYPNSNDEGGNICTLRSNGNTLVLSSYHQMPDPEEFPNCNHIVQGIFDGDGGVQILYKGKSLDQDSIGWHILDNPKIKRSSQKVISITDGLGARDSISYGLLTDNNVYSLNDNTTLPQQVVHLAGAMPVVKTRTEFIPSESRTTDYSYTNGLVHLQGKGFLGFEGIRTESSTGIVTETLNELNNEFYVLLPRTTTEKNDDGDNICQEVNNTVLEGIGPRSYTVDESFHRTDMLREGFYESENSSIFQYGFPTHQIRSDSLFQNVQDITYWESPFSTVWLKGLPSVVEITKSVKHVTGDDIYETITYERDPSTGLVLKEIKRRNGMLVSTDGYSYNEYGQMTRHYTVPFSSADTLLTRYEYDTYGRLKKEYDPKGLYRIYSYNSTCGTLTAVRDYDGVITRYTYDGFLRETKRYSDVESCQTTRALSNYGGGKYFIKETKTGETPVTAYYDAWERKVAESSLLADSTAMYTDYQYNSNGQLDFISFPHKKNEPTSEGFRCEYDSVFRKKREVDSNGKISTWSYSPMQVTSCIDGVTTTTRYYTEGKISEVEDAAGWVHYDYNADGNISFIYGNVGEAVYEYDTFGRLIRTTDMNGVTKQYSYDGNGYPYRTTIAGSYVETNYDKYGILRSKSWADPGESPHTVSYTYNNKYYLKKEQGEGYCYNYYYDTYGRMTGKTRYIDDEFPQGASVSYQYGSDNHISRMTSNLGACSETLIGAISEEFTYSNGYRITDVLNDTLVWELTRQDRWGNVTEHEDFLGTTEYSFDDYGNMLSLDRYDESCVYKGESYTYNIHTGNMSSKNNVPLTYDNMNRLTGCGNQTYSYDARGNITSQPLVGSFSYNGFRVTAMSAGSSYVPGDSLRISYYKAIERPKSIENEHYKADFYYDGNGDRFMMRVYERHSEGDSILFTRYYLDANAEVTEDSLGCYTYLYYAGGDVYTAPAVMVVDDNENTCIYQITRDNLGSAILYDNAAIDCYENSYSSWGVRTYRVGNNTYFYQPGVELNCGPFYRTYTGHEDLWMFGLINVNARLYSPYLGRFVSPDPLLNSEGGPLLYNPYVYANNNPYKYIDRNGEFFWLVPAIFGGFAAAAVTSYYSEDVFKSIASFVCGAVATGLAVGVGAYVGSVVTAGVGSIGVSIGSPVIAGAAPVIGAGVGAAAGNLTYNLAYSGLTGTPFNFSWSQLGVDVATAMATAGLCTVASKLAPKASKIMQVRHRPTATNPDKPLQVNLSDKKIQPAKPVQKHHFATNKNKVYTPQMEKIANKYGLDLNGEWNMEKLPHQGRHPNEYHKFVLDQMKLIDRMPDMNQMKFIDHFEQKVKVPIRNNPDMLYKNYWR